MAVDVLARVSKSHPWVRALVLVLAAGGSGIGGSWLLGPGGVADDDALRERTEDNARAIADNARAIERLAEDLAASDAKLRELSGADADIQAFMADALITQNQALGILATKVGADVDLHLPELRRWRR